MSNPTNARNASSSGRFYTWGRGERYWSVTTIINGGVPKDALKWWAALKVAEFAHDHVHEWLSMERSRAIDYLKREPLRFTKERADFGTLLHECAESYALKKPMPPVEFPEERRALAAFLDFINTYKPAYEATEFSVYSRRQRYAGTGDAIITIPAEVLEERRQHIALPWEPPYKTGTDAARIMVDYKTGGDVKQEKGVYPEVALQLNAYARADFIGLPNGEEAPIPELDGAACLHLGPAGWRLVPVRLDEAIFKAFLYAREVFRFREVIAPAALGAADGALLPPGEPTDG